MAAVVFLLPAAAAAQIRVNPNGVNVNTQGATTVFLTFGGVAGHSPAEGVWCGSLVSAAPDIGSKCDPATILGQLPARFDRSRLSGQSGFTDIMSIPPSVTRRAYQAAEAGRIAGFFYVRRFVSTSGGPDQYVAVTCRLAGGGARVPFALVDVRLAFDVDTPVLFVEAGDTPPSLHAEIAYTGTGRLRGRWEVVLPGDELPSAEDLLTEATLPVERRGSQRRYTELARFNHFLPPTGRFLLPGPDPSKLPTSAEGAYLVLLRVEATADKEGDSDLGAAGAGTGLVVSGAVAGFPLPPLRYIVGGATSEAAAGLTAGDLVLVQPEADVILDDTAALDFVWTEAGQGALYRLELASPSGEVLHAALLERGTTRYGAPSWLREKAPAGHVQWRVLALSEAGNVLRASEWRRLRLAAGE
jgi:hypothetical protein